jgi:hypothetical protein
MDATEAPLQASLLASLGSRDLAEVQTGTRTLLQTCCDALTACRAAAASLRRRLRAEPRSTLTDLVRLSPSLAELGRAWAAAHGGPGEGAARVVRLYAELLAVRPTSDDDALTVQQLALDGLARTVRRRAAWRLPLAAVQRQWRPGGCALQKPHPPRRRCFLRRSSVT